MEPCEAYEELMSLWIDGLLPEEDRRRLMDHLAECPDCRRCFADLTAIHDAMDPAPIAAPADFAGRVMDQVRGTPQERPRTVPFPRWRRWAALPACCAVIAAGLWGLRNRSPSSGDAAPALYNDAGAPPAAGGGAESASAADSAAPEDRSCDLDGGAPADDAASFDPELSAGQTEGSCPAGEAPDTATLSPTEAPTAAESQTAGQELVDYETASDLFGPGLPACTEESFLGYAPEEADSGSGEAESGCAAVTYVFSWGTVTVEDLSRRGASKQHAGGETSVERGGAAFLLEDAGGGETLVRYAPGGEEGLAYTARFDSQTEREAVFALLLDLEGG